MANEIRTFVDKDGVAHQVDYEYLANKPDIAAITQRIDAIVQALRDNGISVAGESAPASVSGRTLTLDGTGVSVSGRTLSIDGASVSGRTLTIG